MAKERFHFDDIARRRREEEKKPCWKIYAAALCVIQKAIDYALG